MRVGKQAAASRDWAKLQRGRGGRAAMLAGLLLLLPTGASAQLFGPSDPILPPGAVGLPPGAVRRIVSQQGFRVLVPPFRNGDVYVVDVVDDRFGEQERLIVDAYEGRVLRRIRVEARRRPAPDVRLGDRLPFPGESRESDDGAARRPRTADGERGGLFGIFPPSSDDSRADEPRVVPGVGPERPKPRRTAKPKPPARAVVRATPLPPSEPKPAAATSETADKGTSAEKSEPVAKATPPESKPSGAEAIAKPAAPATEAAAAPPKTPAASSPTPPAPRAPAVAQPGPKPAPSEKVATDAKPAPAPKVSDAKRKQGPLNDIPPAPLE